MILYELCGANRKLRFSPTVWSVKYALAHKNLQYQSQALWFTEKEPIALSKQNALPVLQDGENWVSDSFTIARYLDKKYPAEPIFANEQEVRAQYFFRLYVANYLQSSLFRCIVLDIHNQLSNDDKSYFRQSREQRLGASLEAVQGNRDLHHKAFAASMQTVQTALGEDEFLGGSKPSYADYCLMGLYIWNNLVSGFNAFSTLAQMPAWAERMAALYDGLGQTALQR